MKTTDREAIRMVGYLLETNSTVGRFASNKDDQPTDISDPDATFFCLSGALRLVDMKVLGGCRHTFFDRGSIYNAVKTLLKTKLPLSNKWDESNDSQRKQIIEILKNVQ